MMVMEDWQIDFEWLKVRHFVKDSLNVENLPDLQTILFLIGVQELGFRQTEFSKEEKQDLMHIAVCSLLEDQGYFRFIGRDKDGWPHWEQTKSFSIKGAGPQEEILKLQIIKYFS
jgi:hypothetical protein